MEGRVVDDQSNGKDSEHCHGKCYADRRWSYGHRSPASSHPLGIDFQHETVVIARVVDHLSYGRILFQVTAYDCPVKIPTTFMGERICRHKFEHIRVVY